MKIAIAGGTGRGYRYSCWDNNADIHPEVAQEVINALIHTQRYKLLVLSRSVKEKGVSPDKRSS